MYLAKLELHGFKSFAQRTSVLFDPGITAIVGPNGCGKSNIVDAVRWVIGEQRARILRSEKMENVIFNGTNKRKPLGMAEVLLTIENTRGVLPTEYSEVTLGRRLYRSGESEYLLNGVKCRLQDITDLFMDTGMGAGAYSVIELKMIEEILSENHQDRRRLFEEAAGITKYKLRRKQALGKLDTTQADLTRLKDITEEIEKQVRSLKRQAEKAARFKDYRQRLHTMEHMLAQLEFDRLDAGFRTLDLEAQTLASQIQASTTRLTAEEARLESLRLKLLQEEEVLTDRRKTLNDHQSKIQALESDTRLERERMDGLIRDRDRTVREHDDAVARRITLQQVVERLGSELAAAEPSVELARKTLEQTRRDRDAAGEIVEDLREQLQELRLKEQNAAEQRNASKSTVDRLSSRLETLDREGNRAAAELESVSGVSGELESRQQLAARQLEDLTLRVDAARTALAEAAQLLETKRNELAEQTDRLRQVERERDAVAAEVRLLKSIVASYEDFPDAVQFLATTSEWPREDLLTVTDVLACDESDRVALQTALGDMASCIVLDGEADVYPAISLLRSRKKGQATFVLLDRLSGAEPPLPSPQNPELQRLIDLVRVTRPAYASLARTLLHDWYMVDTLEQAAELSRLAPSTARFVARTGEWLDARGLLHGGSRQNVPSPVANRIGRREQLQQLQEKFARLEAETTALGRVARELNETIRAVPHEMLRATLGRLEKELADTEKAHTRTTVEREAMDRRRQELSERKQRMESEIETERARLEELLLAFRKLDETFVDARTVRSRAEETFHAAEADYRLAAGKFNEANVALLQAQNRLENISREVDRAYQNLSELIKQIEATAIRNEELGRLIAASEDVQAILRGRLETLYEQAVGLHTLVEEAEAVLTETRSMISEFETGLRQVRHQREQLLREENQRAIRIAEIQTRIDDLVQHIQADFNVSLRESPIPVDPSFDENTARKEVLDLRQKIEGLGAVNALALEEYEEQKNRLDFLTAQQKDLQSAEATLLNTIKEINTTAAQRFYETYDAIHRNFVDIFKHLFGEEAGATLEMVDPNDPLESPIEIMARPRGKRPSSITQLSGGEKTLTAIALLFAIYLVKPSPFCILDEVDAPLDDANVERFMQLIRDFSKDTQFILVTHNKRTMEAADRMYGITMQEQGVSTLVGVRFDEVAEPAESA